MDLESVFDGPLSSGSSSKKSGTSLSVWQAEVGLRLSKFENCSLATINAVFQGDPQSNGDPLHQGPRVPIYV